MTLDHRLAEDSARTWRDTSHRPPPVPEALRPPAPGAAGGRERHRMLWERHRLRRERAVTHLRESQDPERGLPVAPPATVVTYLRALLRRREVEPAQAAAQPA